jgi:hypothetical protein
MAETKRAKIADIEWLLEECIAFSKAYESKHDLCGNLPYAVKFLENLVNNHLVLICYDGEVKTGFIAGMIQPHHFNPDMLMLSELLWWVKKEHRGGLSGSKLLDDFIAVGKEHCQWITFTIEKGTQISDEPLLKRGFVMTEKAYLLECE